MNLVRLEPGQLWLLSWKDPDPRNIPGDYVRNYLILLLWWDKKEEQWWIIKRWPEGRMRIYASANMWNEEFIDLDTISESYRFTRVA